MNGETNLLYNLNLNLSCLAWVIIIYFLKITFDFLVNIYIYIYILVLLPHTICNVTSVLVGLQPKRVLMATQFYFTMQHENVYILYIFFILFFASKDMQKKQIHWFVFHLHKTVLFKKEQMCKIYQRDPF